MDEDIDNELLLLAGGASSDEEDDAPAATSRRDSSPDRKAAGKASGRKTGGRATGRRQNDSEDEGEISSSPSSPNSRQSAPMDESESESDESPAFDEGEKYPLEGKFINNADKAKIMAMPEINREELLAERAQDVERERQTRALRQLLKAREDESKKQDKKRKAGAADLEDNHRKTSRQRTKLGGGKVGEASTGIDSLKRARAEKTDRQRRRDEDKDRNKDRRFDDHSDQEDDRNSEVDWDDGKNKRKSKSPEYRDAQPADLYDCDRIRVGRSGFAQVCFYPGMEEALTGCFTRVVVGRDEATGGNIYRMGLIKGFTEDKPYAITNEHGKTFITSQYVIATIGKSQRNWPFIVCSDSKITEAEFNRYIKTCQVENVPLPMKPKTIQKLADINNLLNRRWTEAELQEKLTRSGALSNKYVSIERNRLNNLLAEARAQGNTKKEAEVREELSRLDGPKLAFNTSLHQSPRKSTSSEAPVMNQQDRIALLNRQNRKKNIEEVRQAQIAERRKAKRIEAALARGEDVVEDTSRRVKTRAKVNYDVSEVGPPIRKTDNGTPVVETPSTISADTSASQLIAKLQAANAEKKGSGTIRRPIMDDDIIGAIDFGIDMDLGL